MDGDHRQHHLPASSHHRHHHHQASSLRAFVDTGAEVTVLSAEAAQRAGLLHLLDRRYAGRATGVGSCRVLGRLPAGCATLVLGRECGNVAGGDGEEDADTIIAMPCPQLTVLEETGTEEVDLLIGLDVLDEYGASISLRGCTLTMDQSPTTKTSSAPSTEPPAQRIVIALARSNCDGDVSNNENNETAEQSSCVPLSSVPPLSNSGASEDVGHRHAPRTSSTDTSRGGWSARRRRGRREDDDLIADLELLEQEASCSHYSSVESDWAEEELSPKTSFPRTGLVGRQEEGGGGGEEDTDEESEEYEDDDSYDMSGV